MSAIHPPQELQVDDTQSFGFIAEIVDKAGKACGMGILIASDRVMTCAHVINIAMEKAADESSVPGKDVRIEVRFPFHTGLQRKGSVLHWYAQTDKAAVTDCCVLSLNAPVGSEVKPARFAVGKLGDKFRACRRTGEKSPLGWVHGEISGPTNDGKHQVSKQKGEKGFLIPGCSGGPVVSKASGHVLGMVVWANPRDQSGHVTPTLKLQQAHRLFMAGKGRKKRHGNQSPNWAAIVGKLVLCVLTLMMIGFYLWSWVSPENKPVFPKDFNAKLDVRIKDKRPLKTGWMLIELTNPPRSYGPWRRKSDHIVEKHEDVVLPGEGEYFITCSLQNPPSKPKSLEATATLPPEQFTYGKPVSVTISAEAIKVYYLDADIIKTF